MIAHPDFSKIFYIEADASDCGVGVVRIQENHPIAYVSMSLGPKLIG
jgi:hypothetical protein